MIARASMRKQNQYYEWPARRNDESHWERLTHSDTLISMNNVAVLYFNQSDVAKVEPPGYSSIWEHQDGSPQCDASLLQAGHI